jgi:hypothetical protein
MNKYIIASFLVSFALAVFAERNNGNRSLMMTKYSSEIFFFSLFLATITNRAQSVSTSQENDSQRKKMDLETVSNIKSNPILVVPGLSEKEIRDFVQSADLVVRSVNAALQTTEVSFRI